MHQMDYNYGSTTNRYKPLDLPFGKLTYIYTHVYDNHHCARREGLGIHTVERSRLQPTSQAQPSTADYSRLLRWAGVLLTG